jgi:hypothetical protein
MRRRRSRRRFAVVIASAIAALSSPGDAQQARAEEGGLFLLVPVGARAVGVGQAVAAAQMGSEAVWWNPAGLARSEKREAAIHHSQNILATGDALTLLIPSSLLGVAALSIDIFDYGNIERTRGPSGATGEILPRNIVYAATYGTPIGAHVNAGLTYKLVQFRVDCSGDCADFPAVSSSTTAVDLGLQYDLADAMPMTFGASIRNLGLRFQVNDEDQADPLPTRLQVGVLYRMLALGGGPKSMDLHLSGDLVNQVSFEAPSARIGADMLIQKTVHLRAGYDFERSEASGASIGVGISAGNLIVDFARVFEGFSSGAGQAPTYLSLRYLF